jgi:hypothetical protein
MKLKSLEDVLQKAPFIPFDIHIDGKTIPVEHSDQVLFVLDRTTIVVAPRDNRFHIIEVDQIKFLAVQGRRKAVK